MTRSNAGPTRWVAVLALTLALALAALARVLDRARSRARDVPLSPLTAGWRVGADYPERRGIVTAGEVAGEMDDLSAYAGPTFDPEAVAPEVRAFYERTADYALAYAIRWHRPFRLGAALASRVTSRVEQLNLPGPDESAGGPAGESAVRELESRFARVAPAADPREGARAWVRTRADGEGTRADSGDDETAVFVAIYAHHEHDGVRYVNIAVPLPGANLNTVLRPENLGDGSGGVELTTFSSREDGRDGRDESEDRRDERDGDEGLYLVTPWENFDLPLDQRFRVRPADRDGGSADNSVRSDAAVVATHEMWLFGRRFLTIRYAARVEE